MADEVSIPTADLPLAANGEVKAYDRLGNKVTVPKDKIGELFGMGGRIAKKAEVAAQQLEDDYAKKSTVEKAAGYLTPALPLPAQMALRGAGAAPLPPELEAYRAGASQTFSLGTEAMATKAAVEAVAGGAAAHPDGRCGVRCAGEQRVFLALNHCRLRPGPARQGRRRTRWRPAAGA